MNILDLVLQYSLYCTDAFHVTITLMIELSCMTLHRVPELQCNITKQVQQTIYRVGNCAPSSVFEELSDFS